MTSARSAPPELPGFTIVKSIGSGGFADVFLYEQKRPSRSVAVKVLRAEHLTETSLRNFAIEADVMAEVSAHPYIVTIHDAGVAPDGRPYIVMEHYTGEHFGLRARGARLRIDEVLRVGIQVASAVETAHRAGILHRDIKPSNILTSALGWPGLTDFGIAGVHTDEGFEVAAGLSLAFAAPEVVADTHFPGSPQSDVYSLAATVYALLAGRSPYYRSGGDNSDLALTQRVLNSAAPPIGRDGVPSSLQHVLGHAMHRAPDARPQTALALAQALQDVEQEATLPLTRIDVRTDIESLPEHRAVRNDPEGTRRRGIKVVEPHADRPIGHETRPVLPVNRGHGPSPTTTPPAPGALEPAPTPPGPSASGAHAPGGAAGAVAGAAGTERTMGRGPVRERLRPHDDEGISGTEGPAAPGAHPGPATDTTHSRRGRQVLIGSMAMALVIIAGLAILRMGATGTEAASQSTLPARTEPFEIAIQPDPPRNVSVDLAPDGTLRVHWRPGREGEAAKHMVSFQPSDLPYERPPLVSGDEVTIPLIAGEAPPEMVCIEVTATVNGLTSLPVGKCVERAEL